MEKKLLNKRALITGSSRGLGRAIALQLVSEGVEVVIHYNKKISEAQSVIKEIELLGGRAHLLQADLADYHNAIRLGDQAWDLLGGIDFLVNNAGISYKMNFIDTSIEDVEAFTNINFKSTLFLTKTVAKRMIDQNIRGSIYTITSINGIQPGVGFSTYGATKGALETLMKGVAVELAPYEIIVNTLAVGGIRTDINAAVWGNIETLKSVNAGIPLGRLGEPQEIAKLVCGLFMYNSYMTGTTLVVDGGWLLKHGYESPGK